MESASIITMLLVKIGMSFDKLEEMYLHRIHVFLFLTI